MKKTPGMFAFCLLLICLGSVRAFSQGGGAEKSKPPPSKPSTPKPPPKRTPARSTSKSTPGSTSNPSTRRQSAPEIELVSIPAGTFTMGSPESEAARFNIEGPQHRVTIPQFYMGKYEVTQLQYRAVMGTNPSNFKGNNLPVEAVSWNDAQEFIRRLNGMQTAYTYRLPTEAEWEYACRAGTTTPFAFGSSLSSDQANFDGNYPYGGAPKGVYRRKTMPVGSFQPNAWGLYDMHRNVEEWCEDWYHDSYNGAPTDGSAWLSGGEQKDRVLRGSAWGGRADMLRSASRSFSEPQAAGIMGGFRVAAVVRN